MSDEVNFQPLIDRLDRMAPKFWFRLAVAFALVLFHLFAFWRAGQERLDLPFNNNPDEAPYYSNPDAPSTRGFPRQPHRWSRLIVSRWDAQHYIGFAVRGLSSCPTSGEAADLDYLDCGLNWLPAYGVIGGAIADVTTLPEDVALVLMSVIAALVLNLLWTSKAITDRIGKFEAYATMLAFNLFPTAFYIVTPYPEGTTMALALAAFICLIQDRWILAGIAIGASTAMRPTAVGFAAGLAFAAVAAAYQRRKAGNAKWWRPLLSIPLAGWGQALQMLVLQIVVGDGMAYMRAHDAFSTASGATGGLRIWNTLDLTFYLRGFSSQHMDTVTVVGMFFIVALGLREALKKWKLEEAIFLVVSSAVMVIIPLAAVNAYWGLNRYVLLCPLVFFCTGAIARKHKAVFALWLVLCLAIYWHVELCSYISQGDPRVCPCLGKLEAWFPFAS
jgi:hypothetical protein